MATMGRKRANNPLNLPDRVYAKHGAFYYVHRDNRWEKIGTDVVEARRRGNLYNDPDELFGTTAYYLDAFLVHCAKRVEVKDLSPNTLKGYTTEAKVLKTFFGKMQPAFIEPHHIGQYLDLGVQMDRKVRANREKACLSSCFTWLMRTGEAGVKMNPCIGVKRNKETKRARYVEHEEYQAVNAIAVKSVRALLALIYRTLQRPEDIIHWTPANIVVKREADGTTKRIIRNAQSKTQNTTGAVVDIEITPEIDAILNELRADAKVIGMHTTLIRKRNGEAYSYDGLTSMLQRYIVKAGVPSFGFYDLKAKGATDMYLAKVPIAEISFLCGHATIQTTEIYIKQRWRGTAQANKTDVSVQVG